MRTTISAGDRSAELQTVRLTDGRLAGAVPPQLEDLLVTADALDVEVVVVDGDGARVAREATATVVRSGRAWTEARGRLREQRGWARRFAASPAQVVLVSRG